MVDKRKYGKKSNNKNGYAKLLFFILIVVVVILLIKHFKTNTNINKSDNSKLTASENTVKNSKDVTAPEIKFINGEIMVVARGEKFIANVTAIDDIDGDITSNIETTEIDTSKTGEYEVTYKVSDKAGNKTEKMQKVIVRDATTSGVPVLMYHFFYDGKTYNKKDNNWMNVSTFEQQLKYLTENDFYFPTWDEINDYLDGKRKLPTRSIVLTYDDGDPSFFDLAVPLIQKYKVPSTSFVITGWYGYRYNDHLDYIYYESHSNDMHESGDNGKGRMVNWSYDKIVEDLKTSSNILGGADIFCYPFGHYNSTAEKALKDSGFKMAFTVEGGKIKSGQNKYELPRVRVTDGNSMNYFINSVQ